MFITGTGFPTQKQLDMKEEFYQLYYTVTWRIYIITTENHQEGTWYKREDLHPTDGVWH
jgi:hypothetical protein